MQTNYLKLSFYSLACNEGFARDAVAAFCVPSNPTLSILSDIKTAVSEAVTNCIVHAYRDKVGIISVECTLSEDSVHIIIKDSGRGIEDVEKALQPFYTTQQNDERSGMGFTIMQTFMDDFSIQSAPDKGTVVAMTKQLKTEIINA